MAFKNSIAHTETVDRAWWLIDQLHPDTQMWEPPVSLMVVLPRPGRVEIWPAVGSPLRGDDRKTINRLIKAILAREK